MLIELTDSLMSFADAEKETVERGLSNILHGYWEGNHLLMASPRFCDYFGRILKDPINRASLHHLDENASFVPSTKCHLKVVLTDPDPNNMEVSILFFVNSLSIQPSFFLCESFNDVRFYKLLVKFYYPYASISSFDLCGGGGAIGEFFEKLKRKNCLSLTIVDSDYFYPGCSLGKTANACKSHNNKPRVNAGLYILDCREVENLIPINSVVSLCSRTVKSFIHKVREKNRLDFLKYYDYKCGLTKAQIVGSKDLMSYVEKFYSDVYKRNLATKLGRLSEDDLVLPVFKKSILQLFNEKYKYMDTDCFDNDRKAIADFVFSFLCSRGREPFN